MSTRRPYEEIADFIAAQSPRKVIVFRPSEAARARVAELVKQEKTEGLNPAETSELDHYLQIEHIMRLAKARARKYLAAS